jgi:hypothetical protein
VIKRLSVIVGVVAGLALIASPAGAAVLVAHKAGDGTLQTDSATGTVRFDGSGVAYGSVNGKGTIKVKGTSFKVGHWSSRKKASTGWWTYTGRNMSLSVSNTVHLRITGGGVDVRVVADGSGYIRGTKGRYLINSSGWRAMPSGGRSFSL